MKTAIIYYSKHHGNTKQLLDVIAAKNDVTLIDVSDNPATDLSGYDRIGFASGIYYSKFHKTLLAYAQKHLPEDKPVFFIYTYASEKDTYTKAITEAVKNHNAHILGEYGCYGFNTFGPLRLVGGICKGHPDNTELENAVFFYNGL